MSEFTQQLEAMIPRMRRYARSLTRDTHRADDLVQDALERAWSRQHLFEPGTNIQGWIFRIMHNQYVNNVRRGLRQGTGVDIEQAEPLLIAASDPSARRQLKELDAAIGRLCNEQRETLLLICLEGMSYEEAAAVLGVPIGTVRSRLSRARENVREITGIGIGRKNLHREMAQAA